MSSLPTTLRRQLETAIKHARKILGTHARYASFLDYGGAADYEARLEEFRVELARKK